MPAVNWVSLTVPLVVGIIAWFINNRLNVYECRRLRYIEVASCVPLLLHKDTSESRAQLMSELSKLYIEGDRKVLTASSLLLSAIESGAGIDESFRNLVVVMRHDSRFFGRHTTRDDLRGEEINLRAII